MGRITLQAVVITNLLIASSLQDVLQMVLYPPVIDLVLGAVFIETESIERRLGQEIIDSLRDKGSSVFFQDSTPSTVGL